MPIDLGMSRGRLVRGSHQTQKKPPNLGLGGCVTLVEHEFGQNLAVFISKEVAQPVLYGSGH